MSSEAGKRRRWAHGRLGNMLAGGALLLVAGTVLLQAATIGEASRATDPGPGGYPRLLAGALIGLVVLLVFQRAVVEKLPNLKSALRLVGAVALMLAYALLLGQIGYLLATALFLGATMHVMSARPIWLTVLLSVVLSMGLFLLFYAVLGVSLPRGTLERMII